MVPSEVHRAPVVLESQSTVPPPCEVGLPTQKVLMLCRRRALIVEVIRELGLAWVSLQELRGAVVEAWA